MPTDLNALTEKLSPLTAKIVHHPLYRGVVSLAHVRSFMEQHVFAVWDFMCLLKELYRNIVSTAAPWFPPKDALSANLIHSILLDEEGDLTQQGEYASHFEMYLCAMEKIGANTAPIQAVFTALQQGHTLQEALAASSHLRAGTKAFVLTTFSFFDRPVHELAAAFVYGREGITTPMFMPLLTQMEADKEHTEQLSPLIYYFKRHIELDNNTHFPKALKMLSNLIGSDPQKLAETEKAATRALVARIDFLTDIHHALSSSPPVCVVNPF